MELEAFCQREYPKLVAALGLICGNRQIAEDIAQETLVRVWDHWPRVGGLESPGGWAYRVALNLARSHVRRRGAERRANERASSDGHAAPEHVMQDESLREALLALPVRDRQVLVLRFYLQYSVAETADVLDIPTGTVKTTTARGLGALRRIIGDIDEESQDA